MSADSFKAQKDSAEKGTSPTQRCFDQQQCEVDEASSLPNTTTKQTKDLLIANMVQQQNEVDIFFWQTA